MEEWWTNRAAGSEVKAEVSSQLANMAKIQISHGWGDSHSVIFALCVCSTQRVMGPSFSNQNLSLVMSDNNARMPAPLCALLINGSKIWIIASQGSLRRRGRPPVQSSPAPCAAHCPALGLGNRDKLWICWIIQNINTTQLSAYSENDRRTLEPESVRVLRAWRDLARRREHGGVGGRCHLQWSHRYIIMM